MYEKKKTATCVCDKKKKGAALKHAIARTKLKQDHLDPRHGASKGTHVIALTKLKPAIARTKLKQAHLDRSHGASKGTQHSIFRQTELRAEPEGGAQKDSARPKRFWIDNRK